ncbi:MAG TPA: DNA adenine methylase, partial [Gemmatimonadaceae bacterium]|nr:DNA adenine methylase [Gemmatimonadaceae bacterium]
ANTAGIYASYMKGWQVNARRSFRVVVRQPAGGALPANAHLMDAAAAATNIGEAELIYIDPPYNSRQYVAYYHVPEIIARGWFDGEPALRGKVGLLAGAEGRSDWSHGRRVKRLFSGLLSATGAKHALVSFGSEGHLSADALTETLLSHSVDGKVSRFAQRYRRYRADGARTGKTYHADAVTEQLFHIRLR